MCFFKGFMRVLCERKEAKSVCESWSEIPVSRMRSPPRVSVTGRSKQKEGQRRSSNSGFHRSPHSLLTLSTVAFEASIEHISYLAAWLRFGGIFQSDSVAFPM